MTTLKSLVDETTNIKNELVECHSNLSSILTSKNVEVAEEENKLPNLIDKVNELGDAPPPPLYLYKEGDECVGVTGGWEGVDTYTSGGTGLTFTKNSNNLETYTTYDCGGFFVKNTNMIDFTPYSKIYFDVEVDGTNLSASVGMYNNVKLLVKNEKSYNATGIASLIIASNGRNTYAIDVKNIKGCYYPVCETYMNGSGYVRQKVYKIWLEV